MNRSHSNLAVTVVTALALQGCGDQRAPTGLIAAAAVDAAQFSDWSAPINLGPPVNATASDAGSAISRDGLSLYVGSNRPGGCGDFDIWVAGRASVDEAWGEPENLGCAVNSSGLDAAPILTIDGHRLYFHSDRPGGAGASDLYVSRRHDTRDDAGWQAPENLGNGVNTARAEVQPALFEDDESGITTLFFAGRGGQPGGLGLGDIYHSTLQSDGTFGPAVLVPELSSASQDQSPSIRRDGLEMLLASNRPETLGGLDLWVSTRASTSDPWSTPANLGPAVNSAAADDRPTTSFDGSELYFRSDRAGGVGGSDVYLSVRSKLKEPE